MITGTVAQASNISRRRSHSTNSHDQRVSLSLSVPTGHGLIIKPTSILGLGCLGAVPELQHDPSSVPRGRARLEIEDAAELEFIIKGRCDYRQHAIIRRLLSLFRSCANRNPNLIRIAAFDEPTSRVRLEMART